jgi:hypothetical protein
MPRRWQPRIDKLKTKDFPHGTHARYNCGCKCLPCRAAHSRFNTLLALRKAQGRENPVVPGLRVITHIKALRRAGMGLREICKQAGVKRDSIRLVLMGQRNLRKQAALRILALRYQPALGSLIDAAPTWRLIRQLLAEGYPKARIAYEMGMKTPALQIKTDMVTVRTALRVRIVYYRLVGQEQRYG